MCGITGAVWFDPSLAVNRGTLERMTTVLSHRGPDDEGFLIEEMRSRAGYPTIPGVALGFRRLSIIDLSGGHQPIANEDGSCWVILNGEIYNFLELRRRLETSGHILRTRTDTEVIVHLYEDLGLDFVQHLVGMFGIAIWDGRRGRLILARDRLGQKPLIYRHDTGRLLFASELKSLLQVPGIPRRLDPSALDAYLLYQYVPHPMSMLEGFRKLPPAHVAVYEDDRLTISRYWEPDWNKESGLSYASAREAVREATEESIRLRMRSDVPVGVFLSGGIDSTIVAGLAAKQADTPIASFSIGFSEAEFDESHVARNTAARLGTAHYEFRVEPDALEILPKLAWHFDEPFGDSSAVPTWYVAQLAREHVKVALSGDGGDELFAGYDRYRAVRLAKRIDRLPGPLKNLISHRWWQSLPSGTRQKSRARRWKRFVAALRLPVERRYMEWIAIFNEARRGQLYSVDFVTQLASQDPAAFVEGAFALALRRDPLTRTSLADLVTYLPCDLMTKVDMATMAHGLECRQPFLDHRLVELAMSLPIDFKVHGREAKWILKEAFADLIPTEVRKRPKMGFGVPLDRWFRHELRDLTHDALLDSRATSRGYFHRRAIEALISEHLSGHFNHGYRLWSLLVLELWCRQWLDSAAAA